MKKIKDIIIVTLAILVGGTLYTKAALLAPNRPGGLLQQISLQNLILTVANPFTINGSASSTITGDGSLSRLGGALSVNGQMTSKGAVVATRVLTASTTYSMTVNDTYLGLSSTTPQRTITLPAATSSQGVVFVIKDQSGNASTTNIVVQSVTSTQMIDSTVKSTSTISTNYGVLRLISDGSNWFLW